MNSWNYLLIGAIVLLEAGVISFAKKGKSSWWYFIPLYAIVGVGLGLIIEEKGLAAGHALFDLYGIVVVTLIATFYLNEEISNKRKLGLLLALISIYLLD